LPAETENWVKCCLRLLRKAASLTVGESTSNLTNGWRLSVNAELTLHSMPTGKRSYGEILPWDHIDVGVSKKFLEREHEKALKEEVTPNCRANCSGMRSHRV